MNPFEMVVLIVAIVMIASVFKARSKFQSQAGQNPDGGPETLRLRDEVKELKERMKVIERIVTDRGADTAAQIEALRERDRIS